MTRLVFAPAARADLDAIWTYTAERWGDPQAERYLLAIRDACQGLAAGTRHSRAADEIRAGYRKAPVGAHILFFRRTEAGACLIVRILHQRMDPTSRL